MSDDPGASSCRRGATVPQMSAEAASHDRSDRSTDEVDAVSTQELDPDVCLELIQGNDMGRVAITVGALPAIVPIRYCVIDGAVIFKATKGSNLAAASADNVVAFEVDHHDRASRFGWRVMAQGRSRLVVDPSEVAQADRLALTTWPPEPGPYDIVRIRTDILSGIAFRW